MPVVHLSCRMKFCASHRLHNPEFSDEENRRIFDKCNHANGHGHNYVLYVVLKGPISDKTGMIMNVHDIEEIVHRVVMPKVDHKYLNMDVTEFKTLIPTVENIAVVIWNWLKPEFSDRLHEVRIEETEEYVASYFGE